MADNLSQQIEWLGAQIAEARSVACMTGAGVSAESGVPTFRGAGGLWEGQRAEELATPNAFHRDPDNVWRFYLWRRKILADCKPNPTHYALADMEKLLPHFHLITQNVDGLHHTAGNRNITALHGDIWIDRCTECGHETRVNYVADEPPHCPDCGSLARPGVVWFGESLPMGAMEQSAEYSCQADVMLVIGTSSMVQPAASLADLAKARGTVVVEINLEPTPLTPHADATLLGRSGEIMPSVVDSYRSCRQPS